MGDRVAVLPAERDVRLRTNFWVIPLAMAIGAALLALVSVVVDHLLRGRLTSVPTPLLLSADDAKTLLATLAGASITVVALVVSLTMVVLSLVATNLGPRIIRNFIRRLSTQLTIGAFIATFVFTLLVLVSVSSRKGATFIPQVSAWVAVVLVLGSTAVLVAWVHDLAFSIQIGNALVDIARDLYAAIERRSRAGERQRVATAPDDLAATCTFAVPAPLSGYVQHIDLGDLVAVAARRGVAVRIAVRSGEFATVHAPLAWCTAALDGDDLDAVRRTFTIGAYRTLEQDLDHAIAQYVEIALRALSPAVNDPFTGVACINWIGDALVRLAALPAEPAALADGQGRPCVILRPLGFEHTVAAACDQLRQVSGSEPVIAVALLTMLEVLVPVVSDASGRRAIAEQVDGVARAVASAAIDRVDREKVDRAVARVRAALSR